MSRTIVACSIALALAAWAAPRPAAAQVATLSFSGARPASYPGTVQENGKSIRVDLSAIPPGTPVYRAVLRLARDEGWARGERLKPVRVTAGGAPLELLPPRFTSFDATAAVADAVRAGAGQVTFTIESLPAYQQGRARLDVTCALKPKGAIPHVAGIRARHRDGQTLLTWQEVDPPITAEQVTFGEWKALRAKPAPDAREIRYRIYRGAEPFTAASRARAELVDEVGPLTCWNVELYGGAEKPEQQVPRYVVDDGAAPGEPAASVPPGTGIYAHNPAAAGRAYYAVSVIVDGAEDLSTFDAGNAVPEPVAETVGQGTPVLQRIERPKSFNYVDAPELRYYTRWECPPNGNLPSRPIDYLVALPAKHPDPMPAGLHLHCWGANLNGGYGWWYNAGQGAMLISTNQIPYDWWTGYHEALGTWKSWSEGVVRDYTQTRLLSFLDWAATQWPTDAARVFTAGSSMGGSGSPNFGVRHADRFAWVVSWVGVHDPARSPQFKGSYEGVYGLIDWKLKFQDGATAAFDYFNDEWFLRRDPARETPFISFANGKNDGAIGWPQARDYWKALQETRRPHLFVWGQSGHLQRAVLPGAKTGERELGIDIRLDRTLPAFTRCSLDDNPGSGDPKEGDPAGQSNLYLYWETADDTVVDEPGRWSMVLRLNGRSPKDECTVDVTPRRCRQFRQRPGARFAWSSTALAEGRETQHGEAVADEWGLVTVPQVVVTRGGNRVEIRKE